MVNRLTMFSCIFDPYTDGTDIGVRAANAISAKPISSRAAIRSGCCDLPSWFALGRRRRLHPSVNRTY